MIKVLLIYEKEAEFTMITVHKKLENLVSVKAITLNTIFELSCIKL